MSGSRPERVLDPVCGMTVDVAQAAADGRTTEHAGRTYAFCRAGCLRAFNEEPDAYAAEADHAHAAEADEAHAVEADHPHGVAARPAEGLPVVIDAGMRRWYESCSCCLSDAFPDVKAALDAERAANQEAPVNAGICEVAEAHAVTT